MNMRSVLLYGCALVVIVSGFQLLVTLATKGGGEFSPSLASVRVWREPVPRAAAGLVGALAIWYAVRGGGVARRRGALFVPAAGVVLCLLANHHGVGLVAGGALGVGLAAPARSLLAV